MEETHDTIPCGPPGDATEKCIDCAGSGTYTPFYGPTEKCRSCGGVGRTAVEVELRISDLHPDDLEEGMSEVDLYMSESGGGIADPRKYSEMAAVVKTANKGATRECDPRFLSPLWEQRGGR